MKLFFRKSCVLFTLIWIMWPGMIYAQSIQGVSIVSDTLNGLGLNKVLNSKVKKGKVIIDSIHHAPGNLNLLADKKIKALTDQLDKNKKAATSQSGYNLSLENTSRYGAAQSPTEQGSIMNNLNIAGGLNLGKIPLTAEYSYIISKGMLGRQSNNLFKFNFDKEKYTLLGQSSLQKYGSLKNKLAGRNIQDYIKKAVNDKIGSIRSKGTGFKNQVIDDYLNKAADIKELLTLEPKQLKEKLYGIYSGQFAGLANQYKPTNITGTSQLIKDGTIAQDKVLDYAKNTGIKNDIDSIVSVIAEVKKTLTNSGINIETLFLIESEFAKGNIPAEEIAKLIPQENPQGKFLHAIFTAVKDFETGSFSHQLPGPQLYGDVFMQGFQVLLSKNIKSLAAGFGTVNELGSQKDAGFQSSVYAAARNLTFLSVKTNSSSFLNGKLSWVNSFSRKSNNSQFLSSSLPRNSMAFTLSQALTLGNAGQLAVDVSKSASQYRNTLSPGADQVLESRNSIGYYLTEESIQTFSAGLTHSMDLKKLGLSDNVYFSYAGPAYQNPAANGQGFSKTRMGGSLKQRLYHNKLALNLRTDIQSMPTGLNASQKWRNYQVQFDSRYTLSKKYTLSVKYLANGTDKIAESRTGVYNSTKFQLEGNASYKIGGVFANSHLSIGRQNLNNMYVSKISSDLMTINYSQALVMGSNTLSASLFYNKELSAYKLIGNMLNSDISLQYTLFGILNTSTGITYLNNQDIAKQAGIRQNIQLTAGKNFDFNMYADIRKNLIKPLYPDLYSACRAELAVRYFLNDNK